MQSKLVVVGLVMAAAGLALIAYTDPLLRVLIFGFGVSGGARQIPPGFRSGNFTFNSTFARTGVFSTPGAGVRSYALAFLSFGVAAVGLVLTAVGSATGSQKQPALPK